MAPTNLPGIVDGEDFGEDMGLGYDDSNPPTDQGGDQITNGDDTIYGNGGDDTIDGAGGDDVILGDGPDGSGSAREIFQWSEAPNFGNLNSASDFTQDTGEATITFSIESADPGTQSQYETSDQLTDGLDEDVDENASFESVTNINQNSVTYRWTSEEGMVENVQFRVNDLDGDGVVVVRAYDAHGNEIPVTITDAGSGIETSSNNGLPGDNVADSADQNYTDDDDPEHSFVVNIEGPVAYWELEHSQDAGANSGINITDIAFDVPGAGTPGNDMINGGDGDDYIDGGAGDDTLSGDCGDDTLIGGAGDDVMTGGKGNDVFIETAGDGADTITDFGAQETGPINDGDQTNNDFVDLSAFYNDTTLADVNAAGGSFGTPIEMLREDAADGTIDGVIGGVDYSGEIGDVNLTLQDGSGGSVTGKKLTYDNTNVPCFVRGTLIATRRGSVPIEDLKIGDEVITMDHGFQKIRWVGSTTVPADGKLAPVVFRKGAMGNERDLRVSPQHRMLVRGWHVELMFGKPEALVPAKALINDETVFQLEGGNVDYFHVMFDRHELVYAEGIPSESFHPGHVGLGSFAEDTREEILLLFPELREDANAYSEPVRPTLKVREARVLAENPELIKE